MKKIVAKINKNKKCCFENINKVNKPLARLMKENGRGHNSIKLDIKKGD